MGQNNTPCRAERLRRPIVDPDNEMVIGTAEFVRLVGEVLGTAGRPDGVLRKRCEDTFRYEITRIDRGEPID